MGQNWLGVADEPANNPTVAVAPELLFLAGVAGFEPTNAGIKIPCLTAWRHPTELTKNMGRATSFELAASRATIWRSTD